MTRTQLMFVGLVGVVAMAGSSSGCGGAAGTSVPTESAATAPAAVTHDVALAVEGMT